MTRLSSPPTAPISAIPRSTNLNFLARTGAAVASLVLIVAFGMLVTGSPSWTQGELSILEAVSRAHTPQLDNPALGIDILFGPPLALTILVLSTALISISTRRIRTALMFAFVVGCSWLGSEAIKLLVQRPRPDAELLAHPLITETSFSYPSGHTAFVASLAMGAILLARGHRRRPVVIAIGATAAVIVAASRVYLGVHYVTDVAASLAYVTVTASALAMIWNRFAEPRFANGRGPSSVVSGSDRH